MSGDKTVSWQPGALPKPSLAQRVVLGMFLVGWGVATALVCWFSNSTSGEINPVRSLYVVMRGSSCSTAWQQYLNSQTSTVGVAVISDRDAPPDILPSLRWRRTTRIVTEGILVDGVEWVSLPSVPPKKAD